MRQVGQALPAMMCCSASHSWPLQRVGAFLAPTIPAQGCSREGIPAADYAPCLVARLDGMRSSDAIKLIHYEITIDDLHLRRYNSR